MSNKMKFFLIIFFILLSFIMLHSFEPERNDFKNDYQFELYHSWFQKNRLKPNVPSVFSEYSITKDFKLPSNMSITVQYDWENWEIYEQREKISEYCNIKSENLKEYLDFSGSFIYRLNTKNKSYCQDYLNSESILLIYKDYVREEALDSLWNYFSEKRFNTNLVEVISDQTRVGLKISSIEQVSFSIFFLKSKNITHLYKEFKIIEEMKSKEIFKKKKIEKSKKLNKKIDEKVAKFVETRKPENREHSSKLVRYIKQNFDKLQQRELLNNKIENPDKFIEKEFPDYKIKKTGSTYRLTNDPFIDEYKSDLEIIVKQEKDGLNFHPISNYEIKNKIMKLCNSENIDFTDLEGYDIEEIAPFISHLLYEHRSIGTKLLNFLLIHDGVPTTLILNGGDRELLEISSYANLLLLLNKYWQNHIVYFKLDEFRKINGFIEFKGFLFANKNGDILSDYAEIRFQLDKEYKISLIMMILHPQIETS